MRTLLVIALGLGPVALAGDVSDGNLGMAPDGASANDLLAEYRIHAGSSKGACGHGRLTRRDDGFRGYWIHAEMRACDCCSFLREETDWLEKERTGPSGPARACTCKPRPGGD